jgi:hypothetical protein
LQALAVEDVGIFHGHLVYFMAIWYILWPFGIFYGHLVNLVYCTETNLATLLPWPVPQIEIP